jgi:hypothetical protein
MEYTSSRSRSQLSELPSRRIPIHLPRSIHVQTYNPSSLAMISFIISEVPAPMVYNRKSRQ